MKIEVSHGEVIDKLSILSIKLDKIKDKDKLKNISKEHSKLLSIAKNLLSELPMNLYTDLYTVNSQLWEVEDQLRMMEKHKEFGEEFIKAARSVYYLNDKRSEIKRAIEHATGSPIAEEKSYEKYQTQ
jgi:hypothetical protein